MEELKNVISSLQIYIYRMDLESLKIEWSQGSIANIIGFDPVNENLNPKAFAKKYYHPKDYYLMGEKIHQFKTNKLQCWSGIYRIRHQHGHWVWIYSKLNTITNGHSNNSTKLSGMMMDATSVLKTEDPFNTMIKEALKLKHSKIIKRLTHREITIIKIIAKGKSYTQIAKELSIHPETVNTHRKNIMQKLGINNIAMLVCFAKEIGLV